MKAPIKPLLLALPAALLLSACATTPGYDSNADKLASYRANIVEEVSSIPFSGSVDSWTSLGDSALAVWTSPSRAWLLELQSHCPDLKHAYAIGFDSNDGWINAGFDSVVAVSEPEPRIPCRIDSIYRIDVDAMRAAERAQDRAQDSGT